MWNNFFTLFSKIDDEDDNYDDDDEDDDDDDDDILCLKIKQICKQNVFKFFSYLSLMLFWHVYIITICMGSEW